MELAQHILLHTIALINNGESRENVVEKFENGIEFCMQTATDILQLQVNPKSKFPTHFIDKSYAKFDIINNKVVLKEYRNNSINKILEINSPIDFDLFFEYNKSSDFKLLMPIVEHLFYDQVADDMYFVRLAKLQCSNDIKSNKTGQIINEKEFIEIKKHLNILITRKYINKLSDYGIQLNENIIQKWCDAMKIVFNEECWIADTYLKNNMDKVWNIESFPDEYIYIKTTKLLSPKDLEEELEIQIKICSDAVEKIYQSKNFEELKTNVDEMLAKESLKRRKM